MPQITNKNQVQKIGPDDPIPLFRQRFVVAKIDSCNKNNKFNY